MTEEIVKYGATEITPSHQYRVSTDAAGLCGEIVKKTAVSIQGRRYVRVEGWSALATAHGCITSILSVDKVDGGVRAIAELRRMHDGSVIATAEGFVGSDEPTWYGGGQKNLPKRPEYAIRAMAQTRAISRVCRTAFAHVIVLIDAGLETTPAEEMAGMNVDTPAAPLPKVAAPSKSTPAPTATPPAATDEPPAKPARPVDKDGNPVDLNEYECEVGTIEQVSTNKGPKSTRYGVKVGGKWHNTFSATLGKYAAANKGAFATAYFTPKEYKGEPTRDLEYLELEAEPETEAVNG